MEKPQKVTEITIPVPWGVIAGKTYGDLSDFPMLCVHGIQDNCDTFVRLIPLMPKSFYYVCIDLPGHGKSSHFGVGLVQDVLTYVFVVKRVVEHFHWEKVNYIGHSIGAVIGVYFAALFSEHIEKMVSIDAYLPLPVETEDTVKILQRKCSDLFKLEEQLCTSQPPLYTIDEVVEKIIKNRGTEMTSQHAWLFVNRSVIEMEPNKYKFSLEPRLKLSLITILNSNQLSELVKNIQCPLLFIEAKIRKKFKDAGDSQFNRNSLKNNKNVVFYSIEGDHDVHLIHPERLIPLIQSFFLTSKSKL